MSGVSTGRTGHSLKKRECPSVLSGVGNPADNVRTCPKCPFCPVLVGERCIVELGLTYKSPSRVRFFRQNRDIEPTSLNERVSAQSGRSDDDAELFAYLASVPLGLRGWLMAHSLNVMTVGIEDKCAIVVRVIVRANSRLAVISTSRRKCLHVKYIDGVSVWSSKSNMASGQDGLSQANPKERFSACSVTDEVLAISIEWFDAERTKCSVKERFRSREIANANCYMIKHTEYQSKV